MQCFVLFSQAFQVNARLIQSNALIGNMALLVVSKQAPFVQMQAGSHNE